jgi:hypothetical protein
MNQIFQSFLALRLCMEEFFFPFQERAVVSAAPQQAIWIDAVEFRRLGGHILQEVTIVADNHAGEGSFLQHSFKPLNSSEVQVIRGLVKQQYIRRLNQRLHDGKTFLPAAG